MNIKTILLTFLLSVSLYAAKDNKVDFLLKANNETSFMHYEFHNLAYEAAQQKEYEHAFDLYLKIANKGDNRAEYNVGMMYMNGVGVERAKMDAYKWLRRASKHGNAEAIAYFKQMNERYEKKHQEKLEQQPQSQQPEKPKKTEPAHEPVKTAKPAAKLDEIKPDPIATSPAPVEIDKEEPLKATSDNLLYIIIALLIGLFAIAFVFLKKSGSSEEKRKKEKAPQKELKYKSQMLDSTYEHIAKYHDALLKQVNLAQIKHDPKKLQIYYMFLNGMIDYFCQLEKFNDSDQRRIFNTHMAGQVGKENVTSVTQSILEGQRDPSMYHYQAAGGISAKAWHENGSKDALSMLKKVLTEKRD